MRNALACPFASGLPGVGRHQSDLDHLVSPLRIMIPSPARPAEILLPQMAHFMYQGRMPVPIYPVHKIGVDADLVNDLFFLPVPSPTVGGEKAERPTVTGHIHDTFRKLTVKNCAVVKLIQVVLRLKLDRRYHKPFVFQSECKDTDIFVMYITKILKY